MEMPDRIYAERDPETNEKRWYSIKGMGAEYVRTEAAAQELEATLPKSLNAPTHGAWDRGYEAGIRAAAKQLRERGKQEG